MAKVLGVGGVFFRSRDPKGLGAWYERWLGVPVDPSYGGASLLPASMPPGGYTVWAPFPADTTYFDPSDQAFMINLIVDDVAEALRQAAQGGARLVGDVNDNDYGRFGWFVDPEGNKVELWQPKAG